MANCRSCGALINWVKTSKGKNMPVDPEEVDPRECEPSDVIVNAGGEARQAKNVADRHGETWHISHFATCPNAEQHRR